MSAVLIAGCGDVGTALGLELTAAGHRVYGLRRTKGVLPAEIVFVDGDLGARASMRLPAEVDTIVYGAAPGTFDEAAYRRVYVDGPANVVGALRDAGGTLRRFVLMSTTAVYPQCDGSWVDESSPTGVLAAPTAAVLAGEQYALDLPCRASVVRFGGIYGPGRGRLVEAVRSGAARVPPGGPRYTNRIHRDDCAGVLAHLLAAGDAGGVWLGVDHEPADRGAVLRWLAGRLDVGPPPVESTPRTGRPETNKRCVNRKIVGSGYRFRYPTFREGYRAMLAGA